MDKTRVLIFVESRYRVDRKRIRAAVVGVLEEEQVRSPMEVSVAVVGDRKMKGLNSKYRGKESTTNVLSFPLGEGEDSHLPEEGEGFNRVGDIVIAYPQVIREAAEKELLVDDWIDELVAHGMRHLLGIHH